PTTNTTRTSLQHIVEIHPVSEVLISAKEQLEQDILQPQDVNTPVRSPKDDRSEELDKGKFTATIQNIIHADSHIPNQTSLQEIAEIHDLGEAPGSEVLPAAEDFQTLDSSTEDDEAEEPDNSTNNKYMRIRKCHIFWRYEFGPKLGKGGYGYVHAGTRCKDGLKVAVKIAEKTPDMPYIRVVSSLRLPMEIGLTLMANKGPSDPHIIKLLDWQDNPDYYVMVLERPMPSMSLFSFVKLRQRLEEGIARHFMWQVIHAANICCERGVFHRDIKLENLLVNPDTLEVKLIDFGCGMLMKDSAYVTFNGTEMFCPPEFDVDGRYYAKPATVWSLGILLFVMVCGYYPDDKDLQMISKNEWSKPNLSQECCQMICNCLQPDPQQRLVLEEMQLHDWFMVLRLESNIC
uniref:non-specific serine/threonine protein kinase n=1 Tax=Sinocyclocheilus rhinocerous TaxID=307959 RepID=A0A673NDI8_9TELE